MPSAVVSRPSARVTTRPPSMKWSMSLPTVDMASVTRMVRSPAAGGDRDAKAGGGDMEEVDDEARHRARRSSSAAPTTPGLAAQQRRHGVEEMGDAGEAGGARRGDLLVARGGVAGGEAMTPASASPRGSSPAWSDPARCVSSVTPRPSEVTRATSSSLDAPHQRRVMDALPLRVEKGPLEVDAEHAGDAAPSSASRTAAIASAMRSRVSVISVGRRPVVPKRRWASAMRRCRRGSARR